MPQIAGPRTKSLVDIDWENSHEGTVPNKAVYLAIGVTPEGRKDVLGIWIEQERRSVRSRGHFPSDEAATKLIWLQLREVTQKWKMPPREWAAPKAQFVVALGDRFEVNR